MNNILSRIQYIANTEGVSISAIERKIGASKGVLTKAIAKNTDIQAKWLQAIADNYPQYSTHWLITGEGDILVQTDSYPKESSNNSDISKFLMVQIKEKDRMILDQAQEIGRLKEKIAGLIEELKEAREVAARSVPDSHSAAG